MSGLLASWLLCLGAFVALCLAQERHHQEVWARVPSQAQRLALWGLALLLSGVSCVAVSLRPDPGIAWAAWVSQLSLAALAVVALATWWPRWLPRVLGLAAGLGALGTLAHCLLT